MEEERKRRELVRDRRLLMWGRKVLKNFIGGIAMEARVEFYGVDLYGNPVKKTYSLPPDPIYWPTRPSSILVRVWGKVEEHIIERARELGWSFNPHTQTFYRLD